METLPPPDGQSAQHPSPVPVRLPPPPARAAGWERRRTGTWEVCGNFSCPGTARAPGRSSWSREFESRGTPRFQPSLAVVRPVLKRLLEGTWLWRGAGGRERCCPLCRDGDIPEQPRGSPSRGPDASGAAVSVRPACRGSRGGGTWVWATAVRGTAQAGGRSRSDARVPGPIHRAGLLQNAKRDFGLLLEVLARTSTRALQISLNKCQPQGPFPKCPRWQL